MTTDADRLLGEVAAGYANIYSDRHALTRKGHAGRGKPTSRPPTGADLDVHARLVNTARAVLDAHHTAGGPNHPAWRGWRSGALGWRTDSAPRPYHDPHSDTLMFDADHPLYVWAPDAKDQILQPPEPDAVRHACLETARLLAGIPDHDERRLAAVHGVIRHALGILKAAGAFNEQQNPDECSAPYCRRRIVYRALRLCRPCYQLAHRLHEFTPRSYRRARRSHAT